MKKIFFDIQRFDDLATVSFGTGNVSINSGISVTTDRTRAIGSDNDDTLVSSDNVFYLTAAMISLGGGKDSIGIEPTTGNAITSSNVTILSGANNDTIKIFGNSAGIDGIGAVSSIPPVSIDSGDGDDYIDIGASATYSGIVPVGILSAAVTIQGGDGDDKIKIGSEHSQGEGILGATNEISFPDGNVESAPVSINGGASNDSISIYGGHFGIMSSDAITINGGTGSDVISIYGGNGGIGNSTVSIDGGDGADTISVSSIDSLSSVSIVAGSGDVINVGSGNANYIFNSTNNVMINGVTFNASVAGNSADLLSSDTGTSIGNAWNGTVALSGTNSLADIDGSIVSDAGSYQIVDGKLAGTVEPVDTQTGDIVISNGKNYDVVFVIDNTGSMSKYIDDAKSNVNEFAQTLQNSGLNCRYGLVEFGDNNDSAINVYDFTNNIETFVSNVNSISLTGGGDLPESGLEAILNGALTMNFDEEAEKRFIVITDASFHNQGESGSGDSSAYLVTTDVSDALKSNNVTMDVVGQNDSSSDFCRSEWEPLANDTGGKFYLLSEGFPSIFNDIVTNMVNIVDLNLVPNEQTGYFVATQNSDTYTTPIFQTSSATGNDTAVGAVNEISVYVADSDTDRQQTVIIPDNWNVTATKNDDVLMINGSNVTVTGGDGSDVFNLSSDVSTVALMDLNIDEDKLSFGNYIQLGTMRYSIEDDHLVLTADDLRVDLPAMSAMTDEFLDYNVSNAGTSATIRELLYGKSFGSGNSHISFSHWTFNFTPTYSEEFTFL